MQQQNSSKIAMIAFSGTKQRSRKNDYQLSAESRSFAPDIFATANCRKISKVTSFPVITGNAKS